MSDAPKLRAPRLRTILGGRISFNEGFSTIDCIVRNLSDTGAKLAIPSTLGVPEHFDLIILQTNVTRKCRLRWQRGGEMGVSFEEP
jgi:hypothetical protein